MSRKKKSAPVELEPIPPVDEAEFTDVIRKMVNTSPMTREEVEKHGKARRRKLIRKNPETDPRYLPVFDFSQPLKVSPEDEAHVQRTYEAGRKEQRKKKA